jgi:hypothetical protein
VVTIQNVEVTFEVEGEDATVFERHFAPAIARWWRGVQERAGAEDESRRDRALIPPPRR